MSDKGSFRGPRVFVGALTVFVLLVVGGLLLRAGRSPVTSASGVDAIPGEPPAAYPGFQVFCVQPDLDYCNRQADDLGKRDSLTATQNAAAEAEIDSTLKAFSVAVGGSSDCNFSSDTCWGPKSYPSADDLLARLARAGLDNVSARSVVKSDPVPRGSQLIGAVSLSPGCVIVSMGLEMKATSAGNISGTDKCIPDPE